MKLHVFVRGVFCVIALAACNPTVSASTSNGSTPSGSGKTPVSRGTENWSPTQLNVADAGTGTSGPALTDVACSGLGSCSPWFCQCENMKVVNGGFCYQNFCTQASAICPNACAAFNYGKWTGNYGGGPTKPTPTPTDGGGCSSGEQCPQLTCNCSDGTALDVRKCLPSRVCGVESTSCQDACVEEGHGDWEG